MSRNLLYKAAWVLLAVTATILNSSEPTRDLCSVADLDGDCDVDLADYADFQRAFSGATSFELVGEVWDVFYLFETWGWYYDSSLVFYQNGTVDVSAQNTTPRFLFYTFDGQEIVIERFQIHGDEEWCELPYSVVLSFISPDELSGYSYCSGVPRESLRAFRRF